jgi:hypothetical protein
MYGMEKKKGEKFTFDLEKEIQEKPGRAKELLQKVETRMQQVKHELRQGHSQEVYDQLGVLLHGYSALQKVLKKAAK